MNEYKKLKHKPSILSDFTPEGLVVVGLIVLGAVIVVITAGIKGTEDLIYTSVQFQAGFGQLFSCLFYPSPHP